jgi:hypothetical protein
LEEYEKGNEISDEHQPEYECAKWCYSKKHKNKPWEKKCNLYACSTCSECPDEEEETPIKELHQTEMGAESCPGVALTTTECEAAAVSLSITWDRVDEWSNGPAGCFTNDEKVYLNTKTDGASSNPKWRLICHTELHQTEMGAESCPGVALTTTECKAAAVSLSITWDRVDEWSNGPAGCFTNDKKVYFNTKTDGASSNPNWRLICHAAVDKEEAPPAPAPPQQECDDKRCYNAKNGKMRRNRCNENKCAACSECGKEQEPKPAKDKCSDSCFSKRSGSLKKGVCGKNKCSGCSGCPEEVGH